MTAPSLLRSAADVVVTSGSGAVHTLQRRLHVGYGTAEELMDELEFYGIVGPDNGGQPRVVLARVGDVDELLDGAV